MDREFKTNILQTAPFVKLEVVHLRTGKKLIGIGDCVMKVKMDLIKKLTGMVEIV